MYLFSLKNPCFTTVHENKCIRGMEEMLFLLCSNTICTQPCLTNPIVPLVKDCFKGMIGQGKMVLIHLILALDQYFLLDSYNNKCFAPRL